MICVLCVKHVFKDEGCFKTLDNKEKICYGNFRSVWLQLNPCLLLLTHKIQTFVFGSYSFGFSILDDMKTEDLVSSKFENVFGGRKDILFWLFGLLALHLNSQGSGLGFSPNIRNTETHPPVETWLNLNFRPLQHTHHWIYLVQVHFP